MPGHTPAGCISGEELKLGETESFITGSMPALCSRGRHCIPSVHGPYPENDSLEQRAVSISLVRREEVQ